MKKLLLSMSALTALAVAMPAAAQSWNNGYANQNNGYANQNSGYANAGAGIDNRLARLDARIQAGVQSGAIDRAEARSLRQQLRDISRLDRQYSRNGYTEQERADLRQRLRAFRDELAYADGGRNGQYGANSGRYGANDGQYGANDDYYGQGGPYEEVNCDTSSNSGGLGGLIGSIFGGRSSSDDCNGLRIGQRVSGNLGAVPYQYRNRYRDTGSVYYRSDGRQIYQIDARTNTVLRIFGM